MRGRAQPKPYSIETVFVRDCVHPRPCWSEAVVARKGGRVLVEVVVRDSIAPYSPATQYFL